MSVAWVAVGATVLGAASSSRASKKASEAQTSASNSASAASLQASQEANALQEKIYDQNRADSAPWRDTGAGALNQLAWKMGITPTNTISRDIQNGSTFDAAAYLKKNPDVARDQYYGSRPYQHYLDWGEGEGRKAFYTPPAQKAAPYKGDPSEFGSLQKKFGMEDFQADPGYQFRLDEGNKGIERSAAARGGQLSGATMKALARFGQDTASNEYQNAYNRFNNDQSTQFNRLSGIAGTGQQQVNALGQAGQNYANSVGNNTMNTANRIADNTIGVGNARAGSYMATANGINNAIGTGINTWQQQQYLNKMGTNNMTSYGTQAPAPVEYR